MFRSLKKASHEKLKINFFVLENFQVTSPLYVAVHFKHNSHLQTRQTNSICTDLIPHEPHKAIR